MGRRVKEENGLVEPALNRERQNNNFCLLTVKDGNTTLHVLVLTVLSQFLRAEVGMQVTKLVKSGQCRRKMRILFAQRRKKRFQQGRWPAEEVKLVKFLTLKEMMGFAENEIAEGFCCLLCTQQETSFHWRFGER